MTWARPSRFLQWSYSRLRDYVECPKKAFFKHLDKRFKEPGSPALDHGDAEHKAYEGYVTGVHPVTRKRVTVMPPALQATFPELAAELRAHRKEVRCEVDLACTRDWQPTTWDDWDHVWLRAKADVLWIWETDADVIDWKTGRVHPEAVEQLGLYAVGVFVHHPQVMTINASLRYTEQPAPGNVIERTYVRELDFESLKKAWEKKSRRMLADATFKPTPGNACRFCFFGQNGKRKGGPGLCKY